MFSEIARISMPIGGVVPGRADCSLAAHCLSREHYEYLIQIQIANIGVPCHDCSSALRATRRASASCGFSGAGTWLTENLEGKATLRAIIADGRWPDFREHDLRATRRALRDAAQARICPVLAENRLAPDIVHQLGLEPPPRIEETATVARLASWGRLVQSLLRADARRCPQRGARRDGRVCVLLGKPRVSARSPCGCGRGRRSFPNERGLERRRPRRRHPPS